MLTDASSSQTLSEEPVPPRPPSSSPDLPRLTIIHLMAAIAALAVSIKFLPVVLSAALAVTVVGILVLQSLRLPLITDGCGVPKRLPWVLWSLALAACPVGTAAVGILYENDGPPTVFGPHPWATHVVDGLGFAHLGISVVASVAVVVMTRGGYRWLAWGAVLAVGVVAFMICVEAWMSTTGIYL